MSESCIRLNPCHDFNMTKTCSVCNIQKSLSAFHKHKNTLDGRHSYCKQCGNEQKRRRTRERKQYLLDLRGGCCKECGYFSCNAALDFHHRNPSEKSFELNVSNLSRNMPVLIAEAKKCDILCARCHRELEDNFREILSTIKSKTKKDYRIKAPVGTSKCSVCKQFKKLEYFYKRSMRWNGVTNQCKDCFNNLPSKQKKNEKKQKIKAKG